jgi:hypothetical protein
MAPFAIYAGKSNGSPAYKAAKVDFLACKFHALFPAAADTVRDKECPGYCTLS